MAVTQNTYTGNGSTVLFSFTFPYLDVTDIKVSLNGTLTTAYTLANATTIQFNSAPANGAAIRIYRETDDSALAATFYPGSAIRSQDLNDNFIQNLYAVQEVVSRYISKAGDTLQGILNMGGFKIVNLGTPSASTDAATKGYVDQYVLGQSVPDGNRGDITVSGNGLTWTLNNTFLTISAAASTYQTQAGMSSYVPTSAIGSTVQAYNANTAVTNVAQTFSAAQRGAYVTLTDGATVSIDMSQGNNFQVTLGGNRTLGAPTNVVAGQSGVIRVIQDATGSRTLAYNSIFKFPGGTAPTLTTAANSVDLLAYAVETTGRIAVRFIGDVK